MVPVLFRTWWYDFLTQIWSLGFNSVVVWFCAPSWWGVWVLLVVVLVALQVLLLGLSWWDFWLERRLERVRVLVSIENNGFSEAVDKMAVERFRFNFSGK